ncbi:unnamed protein product [Linum tenue]|uniref:Peptidase A1 domain-containing protein n=1 Tax=Linum tenue TaxID=586396 RepID=A0AAV0KL86_9ROSI|nr:unnamed protein product [Linum tenue]
MASPITTTILALSLSLTLTLLTLVNAEAAGGFTVDLVHRDSSSSPFYDPLETPAQRIRNSLKRSFSRAQRFSAAMAAARRGGADSPLAASDGEYLMNISLGTPPFPIVAIADTGSDLIWTQCKPCTNCYKQNAAVFSPNSSSTYKTVPCQSSACDSLQSEVGSYCSSNDGVCQYEASYGDQSHTKGDIAVETLTLGSTAGPRRHVAFPKMVIGCGHDNAGTFSPKGSGIVGLGGGSVSLVTQLGPHIGGKFSYCLVPSSAAAEATSTLSFGQSAVVSGNGVATTPLIPDPSQPTFYVVQLEAVSVGSKKIPFHGSTVGETSSGNIIVDSGTTLTLVPTDFFTQLSSAVESQVTGSNKTTDPQGYLSLCYVSGPKLKVPSITAHFKGADVALTVENVFIKVSDTVACLAFYGNDDVSIYGNVAQQNFRVGYDLQKHTLSFKPTDCTQKFF